MKILLEKTESGFTDFDGIIDLLTTAKGITGDDNMQCIKLMQAKIKLDKLLTELTKSCI